MVESGKNIFQSYFLETWRSYNEFYGAIDISYQIRGAEFPEKPKLLYSGTCTSTSTRHVNLKSPLLLQFPYCELCDNDNKQSNYRLMNVLFCTRALKVWKHSRQFASVGWQAVNQIDWYFRRTFTKDVIICVQTLRVIGLIPSQWELHTFYLFWGDFLA